MTRRWIDSTTRLRADRRVRLAALAIYYLAIQVAVFLLYAWSSLAAPAFIYQAF